MTEGNNPGPVSSFSINSGLPAAQEDWPDGIEESLERFSQGDLVPSPPLFYFADPSAPVWARTARYSETSDGPEIIATSVADSPVLAMITTQTCDISARGSRPKKPWIQVAPVVNMSRELNDGQQRSVSAGRSFPYLIHAPAVRDGFWVADLRIEVPVEKGWLATVDPIDGFDDEAAQRRVGQRLAEQRGRAAWSDVFVEQVRRPLEDRLARLESTHPDLHARLLEQVDEVAILADSFLNPTRVEFVLIGGESLDADVLEWWRNWWDQALPAAADVGIRLLPPSFRDANEVTLLEYRLFHAEPLRNYL